MTERTIVPAVLGAALLLVAAPARAEETGVETSAAAEKASPTEDLEALVALARARNRDVRAARAMARAASHRIRPAGSLEDPTLGLAYQEGMARDFPTLGEDIMSQVEISLEQMFPGPGKRRLRREVAEWMWREAEAEVRAMEWRVVSEVRARYWEIYRIDAEAAILERTRENLRAIAAGAETRYSVGEGLQEDVLRAGLEVSMTTERIRMLERERRTEVAMLNALLDRPPDAPIGRPAESPTHDLPEIARMEALARDTCPSIVGLQYAVLRNEAGVRLAERERGPDWGVMGAVMPRGALPTMFAVGLKITLPIRPRDRQDEWVREAEAMRDGASESLEAHWREVRARMEDLYATAETARDLTDLYDSSIVPQASFALQSSLAGYLTGRVDFMTVIANVVALRQYEVERVRRLSEFHRAVAELEAIVARDLEEVM